MQFWKFSDINSAMVVLAPRGAKTTIGELISENFLTDAPLGGTFLTSPCLLPKSFKCLLIIKGHHSKDGKCHLPDTWTSAALLRSRGSFPRLRPGKSDPFCSGSGGLDATEGATACIVAESAARSPGGMGHGTGAGMDHRQEKAADVEW